MVKPLQEIILRADVRELDYTTADKKMQDLCKHVKIENQRVLKEEADEIHSSLDSTTRRAMELAQEKGASFWLTSIPIVEHRARTLPFYKRAFRSAVAFRYGWREEGMLSTCACKKANVLSHALSCHKGGYIIHCHNDIRDTTAAILKETPQVRCVEIEPPLQPLTREVLNGCTAHQDDNNRLHFSIHMYMIYHINPICIESL